MHGQAAEGQAEQPHEVHVRTAASVVLYPADNEETTHLGRVAHT